MKREEKMMKAMTVFVVVVMLFLSGCVRTYVFEKERVDQQLTGNRGVLMGEVPQAPKVETPPKRTIIGIDVEIPAFPEIKKNVKFYIDEKRPL